MHRINNIAKFSSKAASFLRIILCYCLLETARTKQGTIVSGKPRCIPENSFLRTEFATEFNEVILI